jgi:hypothetical protein
MPSSDFEQKVLSALARIEEREGAVQQWQDNVNHLLHGNGQPGLLKDVDRLKEQSTSRKATMVLLWSNLGIIAAFAVWVLKHV